MSLYQRSLVLFLSVFPLVVQLVTCSLSQLAFQASVMHRVLCNLLKVSVPRCSHISDCLQRLSSSAMLRQSQLSHISWHQSLCRSLVMDVCNSWWQVSNSCLLSATGGGQYRIKLVLCPSLTVSSQNHANLSKSATVGDEFSVSVA